VDTVTVERFVVETVRDTVEKVVTETVRDTLIRVFVETVRDTVYVERVITVRDTVERIVVQTVRDTVERIVVQTVRDTLIRIMTETVRDTVEVEREVPVYVNVSVLDTVYIEEDEPRLPVQESWSDVLDLIKPALYWIGYTAKPEGGTRYPVIFVGTGFAVNEFLIATNYHVGIAITNGFQEIRNDLDPIAIAVRAGTRAYGDGTFGDGTFRLGEVMEDRDLWGFWDPRYDLTARSPDIALFGVYNIDDGESYYGLDFARLATLDDAMDLQVGEEIGIYGFPGILETTHDPLTLTPNPTFKSGTVSALRPYNEEISLSSAFKVGLMGKFVQHNLETAPGNSGSPIFNTRGEIVAIHNSGIQGGDAFDFGIRSDEIRLLIKGIYSPARIDGNPLARHVNAKAVGGSGELPMISPYPPRVAP
jgi:hypothetical protein